MFEDTASPVPEPNNTGTRRHEVAVIGERRYDLDLVAAPDGRVELEVIGDLDGEVIAEIAGVLPPHDIAALCCLLGAAGIQMPGGHHEQVRRKAYEVSDIRK